MGDNLTRGCSGGEKRRVTTGEFLVGPFHCFFMVRSRTRCSASWSWSCVLTITIIAIMLHTVFITVL